MTSSVASRTSAVSTFATISSAKSSDDNNILKLKLKKPKSWNWELSTSKSSSHIDFPRILLYDSNDKLLADVEEADCVINGVNIDKHSSISTQNLYKLPSDAAKQNPLRQSASFSTSRNSFASSALGNSGNISSNNNSINNKTVHLIECNELNVGNDSDNNSNSHASCSTTRSIKKCKRSLSTNLHDVNELLSNVVSQLKDQGYECKIRRKNSSTYSNGSSKNPCNLDMSNTLHGDNNDVVERNANENNFSGFETASTTTMTDSSKQHCDAVKLPEMPIYIFSGKGLVRRDFNAKEFESIRNRQKQFEKAENAVVSHNTNDAKCTGTIMGHTNETNRDNDTAINLASSSVTPINRQRKHYLTVSSGCEAPRNEMRIEKSKSVSEMLTAAPHRKRERRKVRRVKSVNTGTSSSPSTFNQTTIEWQKFDAQHQFHKHSNCDAMSNKPVYQLCSSAAGVIVVPDENIGSDQRSRRRRRRPRSCNKPIHINETDESSEINNTLQQFMETVNNDSTDQAFNENERMKRNWNSTYSNADKFPSRYHTAMANIDNLITNVILSHTLDSENNKMSFDSAEEQIIVPSRSRLKSNTTIIDNDVIPIDQLNRHKLNTIPHKKHEVSGMKSVADASLVSLPFITDGNNEIQSNFNENSIFTLIKTKNNQFDGNATSDVTIVPNNVGDSIVSNAADAITAAAEHNENIKQKKSHLNRKVSFMQEKNDNIHNDRHVGNEYDVLLNKNVNNHDNVAYNRNAGNFNVVKLKSGKKLPNGRKIQRSASATYGSHFNYVASAPIPFCIGSSIDSDDSCDDDDNCRYNSDQLKNAPKKRNASTERRPNKSKQKWENSIHSKQNGK